MAFSATGYGREVAALLALDGSGERLMPLAGGLCSSDEARDRLQHLTARTLFPNARAPEAAFAGLHLYFSCRERCHELAQGIETAEGSYWHAIVHRQEPDPENSAYWFRQVGSHAVFPALRGAAVACGYRAPAAWDPFAFIDFCESARRQPGLDQERTALAVQRAEWQLLFDFCAGPA
jgi:hypothetical protein